jgi:hypothetical protein
MSGRECLALLGCLLISELARSVDYFRLPKRIATKVFRDFRHLAAGADACDQGAVNHTIKQQFAYFRTPFYAGSPLRRMTGSSVIPRAKLDV